VFEYLSDSFVAGLNLAMDTPVFALILLKTFIDLHSHRKQHSAAGCG